MPVFLQSVYPHLVIESGFAFIARRPNYFGSTGVLCMGRLLEPHQRVSWLGERRGRSRSQQFAAPAKVVALSADMLLVNGISCVSKTGRGGELSKESKLLAMRLTPRPTAWI
jgi:hypothetical protein